jgi:hypothetical protein
LPLLWRRCAALLLFTFVWDIGFELLAPLHFHQDDTSASVIIEAAETDPHPDCGLPDHGCALSHHHHFPALLAAIQSMVLPVVTEHLVVPLPVAGFHRTSATRLIRGPPVAL